MAKFRSWNKEFERFCYFEDGKYYYFVARISDKVIVRIDEENNKYDSFNWQNAEQYTGLKDWFVGDKMQGRYDGKILTGVIEYYVEDATFLINCGVNKYGVASYYPLSSSINFKKVGNIRKGDNNE